jgi:hypothetical protein
MTGVQQLLAMPTIKCDGERGQPSRDVATFFELLWSEYAVASCQPDYNLRDSGGSTVARLPKGKVDRRAEMLAAAR